jgi:putative hydrolase of the HAD superfamily
LALFYPQLFSCELHEVKPHSAIYRKSLICLNADPSGVVFFDDRVENVDAAAAVGMRAYHFTTASQLDELPFVESRAAHPA